MTHNTQPIGIFDSGVGGLTVLRALQQALPNESFIYLGDTARLPYGIKSAATVREYAEQMTKVLHNFDIKCLVVACNTVATTALEHLQQLFPQLPIIGVTQPGAKAACETTRNQCIAVLATETTIRSQGYQNYIHELIPNANIITQSCSLFVALAEEGWIDNDVATMTVKHYLQPILQQQTTPDCVLLGCTHFPALIKPLRQQLPDHITIIDSATATTQAVSQLLQQKNLRSQHELIEPATQFLVTDSPERFAKISKTFLNQSVALTDITLIDHRVAQLPTDSHNALLP